MEGEIFICPEKNNLLKPRGQTGRCRDGRLCSAGFPTCCIADFQSAGRTTPS